VEKQLPISRELSDDWGLSRCFHLLGILARSSGDFQAARSWQEQAIERSKRTNARDTTAVELCTFASLLVVMNDLPAARSNCEEALAIAHSLGIADSAAFALKTLGYIAMHEGNFAQAQSLCKEALSISRSIGAAPRIASMLRTLANVSSATGEYAEAEALYKEALEITQSCDDKEGNANILGDLGLHYFTMRQYAKAGPLLHRSLSIFAALGDKEDVTCALTVLAGFSAETHDHNRAARLFGAVDAAYESMGIGLLPLDRLRYRYDGLISSLRNAMGESAFQSCWDEGRKVTLDSAVKLATE
jgi:tetratricopeptide (TPR) repeat protein